MYGKLMSINDELMWKYFLFLTDLRGSEIEAMRADVAAGKLHPIARYEEGLEQFRTTCFLAR